MKSLSLALLALLLAASACSRKGDDDDNGDGADAGDGGQTIFEVQSDDMPVGTAVTLRGVVVTAIDTYGGRKGGIYVQEPEGGAFSGVFVYLQGTEAAELEVGNLIDVEGALKDEFALQEDESGRTLTELGPAEGADIAVSKVGDGTVPEAVTIVPWELVDEAEAEKWEGVLVAVEDVRVFSTYTDDEDDTMRELNITGPYVVSSALTEIADTIERDDCFSRIVGIGDYFFDYKMLPRSAADFEAGSDDECLVAELGDEACADELDNDHNGFGDCDDNACLVAEVACPATPGSVEDVQNGTIADGDRVALTTVMVTGVSFDSASDTQTRTFWVQDGASAGASKGIAVVWREEVEGLMPVDVVVGAKLDLSGTVDEFDCFDKCADYTVTELTNPVLSNFVAPGAAPTPVDVDGFATLASDTDGEPYEGVLVRLQNVEVVTEEAEYYEFTVGDSTTPLLVDSDIFRYDTDSLAVGDCLDNLVGVIHRGFTGGVVLLPRSAADIDTSGGSCP